MGKTANEVFRDFVTIGVPSSGKWLPPKFDIRELLTGYENVISAFLSNGGLIYASKVELDADLAHAANSSAWVIGDPTTVNNGVYRKNGGPGAGSWTRIADLPYSFIVATDQGSGTANAIVATSTLPISESALILMNVFITNTASPVTVSFNGGAALTIKTNTGNDVVPGGLSAGMVVLGTVSGGIFRLVSDQVSSAIVAAAEGWANVAQAAANGNLTFTTRGAAVSATILPSIHSIFIKGWDSEGDGLGGLYVDTNNGNTNTFQTDSGTRTWYRAGQIGKADGVADDTAALVAADAVALAAGIPLVLKRGGTYLIAGNITFLSEVVAEKVTFKVTDPATGVAPPNTIYFAKTCTLYGCTFDYVNVSASPSSGDADFGLRAAVKQCRFVKGTLSIGHATVLSFGNEIIGNEFVNTYGRTTNAITLVNSPQAKISGNRVQEYAKGIVLTMTRSFSGSGIEVSGNIISSAPVGIEALGSSMNRFTALRIIGNQVAGVNRDAVSGTNGGILIAFAVEVDIIDNSVNHASQGIYVQGCLGVNIEKNSVSAWTMAPPVRISGCQDVRVERNKVNQSEADGYCVLAVSPVNNPIVSGNYYANRNIVIRNNDFRCSTRCIGVQACDRSVVCENRIYSKVAPGGSGFLNFAGSGTNGYHFDNQYYAPSGTAVVVSSGTVTSTRPATTVIATTTAAASVVAPVITASDAALNNAKSYVVAFTINAAEQLHQLVDDDNPKKLSTWMGTVSGEILGWNSSAWTSAGNNVSDIMFDGAVYDNAGIEFHPSARYSMVVIDRAGILSCRDFRYSDAFLNAYPLHIGNLSSAERGWVTATFRPPLVVDGAVYDAPGRGLISATSYNNDISGRIALGQKADGSFVLLAVDGATGSSGCTIAQMAARMFALGCVNAFNLDGGGSTTLWYSGAVINSPSDAGGERLIPACMYV